MRLLCGEVVVTLSYLSLTLSCATPPARGHALEFFSNDPALALEKYGERTFDNLVVFSPQKKLGTLTKADLLRFVEAGGNILLSSRYEAEPVIVNDS